MEEEMNPSPKQYDRQLEIVKILSLLDECQDTQIISSLKDARLFGK